MSPALPGQKVEIPLRIASAEEGRKTAANFALYSGIASSLVILFGLLGIMGWMLGVPRFNNVLLGFPVMVPNTAVFFLLTGVSLAILRNSPSRHAARVASLCFAALAVAIGAITLTEYLAGRNFGIDTLLFGAEVRKIHTPVPGRPAFLASFNFIFLGGALLLLDRRNRSSKRLYEALTVTAILVALLAVIGHVYHVPALYGWFSLFPGTGMAVHTLVAFVALGVGILCSRPESGLAEIIASPTSGGIVARRLLLAPIIIPLGTGFVNSIGRRYGLYNAELFGWLFSFLNVFIFTMAIWWSARLLYQAELVRRQAVLDIHRAKEELEVEVAERKRHQKALEEASRMKSEFLANMSHELRTPLNSIIGFTEFLEDEKSGPLNAQQKEQLGYVLSSGRHLLQLINDVLDLARIEAGKMKLRPENFVLSEAIEEVIAGATPLAREKQLQVSVTVAEGLKEVTLDRSKVKQVLFNLVSNGIKFNADGGSLHVSASPLDPDRFKLTVQDTGIGISAEDQKKLFQQFEQLESGKSRRYQGTGLGLALTRKIVELQGGMIFVESAPGKGSTFSVEFPKFAQKDGNESR